MHHIWELLQELLHPKSIIEYGGLTLLLFVIFAETGLFFGFFLPGDSLLFIAGLLSATSESSTSLNPEHLFKVSIFILIPSLLAAAVLGNFVGYFFGLRTGNILLHRNDSWFFKKKYIDMASTFYHERGGMAIILGRFLPIIRTFVPIFAGIVKLEFRKFALYNIVGGFFWVTLLTSAGYFLGKRFPRVGDHLELVVLFLILTSLIPLVITYIKNNSRSKGINETKH